MSYDPFEHTQQLEERMRNKIQTEQINFEDSAVGKEISELQQMRQSIDQYRSDQAAYQAAAEHREKIAGRKGFILGPVSGIISSICSGLLIYYWTDIVEWFSGLFH